MRSTQTSNLKPLRSSAFGLIETLIAVAILTMVSGAATALLVISVHGSVLSKHKTEAYNLAQEAMEKIKAERENHFKDFSDWIGKNYLVGSPKTDFIYINHQTGELIQSPTSLSPALGLEFKRELKNERDVSSTLGLPLTNAYKFKVTVTWSDYGRQNATEVISYLTNWKPRY